MVRSIVVLVLLFANQYLSASGNGSLPFNVVDSRNKAPVAGASVCIKSGKICAMSDARGSGILDSVIPGLYSVTISASGYDTVTEPNVLIKTGVNTMLTIQVNQAMQKLDKLVVKGFKSVSRDPSQSTSITKFSAFELANTPGTANDINRVIGAHPAVVSGVGADFDNNLYVRGGHSCENVFVVDGIEFENTSHFSNVGQSGGSVGFINGSLVRDLDFYTGGFPAGMPPRLSSVIKVNLRNGSMNTFKTQIDLNMSGLGLVLESPFPNAKGSWIANVRFADLRFLEPFLTLEGVPRFGDGFLKLTFLPTDNSTVTATAVTSMDTYVEEIDITDYVVPTTYQETIRQYGGILNWNYHKNAFSNSLSLSGTRADRKSYDDVIDYTGPIKSSSGIFNISEYNRSKLVVDSLVEPSDTLDYYTSYYSNKRLYGEIDKRWAVTLKDDITMNIVDIHRANAGVSVQYRRNNISNEMGFEGKDILVTFDNEVDTIGFDSYKCWAADSILDIRSGGGYVEYIMETGRLKAIASLRGDYFDVISDYGFSPRLGLRYNSLSMGVLSMSAGVYYQFPAEFNGLIGDIIVRNPNSLLDPHVPLEDVRLQRNLQAVAGYERAFGHDHSLSLETYIKWYDREYPLISPGNRQYFVSSTNQQTGKKEYQWALANPDGKKRSYGAELMFQKKKYDKFYYSGSMSLFSIENKYTSGKWYHDEMDLGKTLNVSVGTNLFKNHGFALRAQLANGRRYTPVVYDYYTRQYKIDSTKEYYSSHLPTFASLNFRYTFKAFLAWGNFTGYIEVMNLLNATPVAERYFDPGSRTGFRDLKCNGILPVAGVTIDF